MGLVVPQQLYSYNIDLIGVVVPDQLLMHRITCSIPTILQLQDRELLLLSIHCRFIQ